MDTSRLTAEVCFAQIEVIEGFLRIPQSQLLTVDGRKLKLLAIQEGFPETSNLHLAYAVEAWMQATGGKGFARFPSWAEVLAPLYREANGRRDRAWGYRPDLPDYIAPALWQQEAVLRRAKRTSAPDGAENPAAYANAAPAGAPQLPTAKPGSQELESVRLEREARELKERLPADHPHRHLIVAPQRRLGMDVWRWARYLRLVDSDAAPVRAPTKHVMAQVRMQARLERLLYEGSTSTEQYNAQMAAGQAVFPRPEFLRKYPFFRDPTIRDVGCVLRKRQAREARKRR